MEKSQNVGTKSAFTPIIYQGDTLILPAIGKSLLTWVQLFHIFSYVFACVYIK